MYLARRYYHDYYYHYYSYYYYWLFVSLTHIHLICHAQRRSWPAAASSVVCPGVFSSENQKCAFRLGQLWKNFQSSGETP